jgi:hypothetical protein
MSGIQMALLGGAGQPTVIVGQTTYSAKVTVYVYGFNAASTSLPSYCGSIANGTFKGAAIRACYSTSVSAGNATSYTVAVTGDQTGVSGFFNSLTVDGTLVGTYSGSGSYNSTEDYTSFAISVSSAATLFGTTNGVRVPIVLT